MYNALKRLPMETPTEVKHAQVVYLDLVLNLSREAISELTGYARSTISTLVSKGRRALESIRHFFEDVKEDISNFIEQTVEKHYAYIVKLYGDVYYTKVGYTNNPTRRFRELSKKYGDVEPVKLYEFDDKENALSMENAMRKHFKKTHVHIPQDRFELFNPSKDDYTEFDKMYSIIIENF